MAAHGRFLQRLLPSREPHVHPVAVPEAGGDAAGERVYLARRVPERPCRRPHRPAQGHGLDGGRLRSTTPTVATDHLEPHLVPSCGAEVQVYVRRVQAALVHEPLEEQPVAEGLRLGHPQAVRDQAVGSASSPPRTPSSSGPPAPKPPAVPRRRARVPAPRGPPPRRTAPPPRRRSPEPQGGPRRAGASSPAALGRAGPWDGTQARAGVRGWRPPP